MAIILTFYLLILIIIAIRSAFNVNSISDFFVAKKGASTIAVTGSLVATILGGSAIIGAIDAGPKIGAASAWFMIVGALGLLALLPLSKKAYSLGTYSLPDLINNMYGNKPRLVASIVISLAWTGIIAAQIIAGAKLLQNFLPFNYSTCAIITASVFVFYTIAGGQLSILHTDFFQAILVIAGLVIILACALFSNIDYKPSFSNSFPFNSNFSPIDLFVLLLTYGTTFTTGPDIYSRILCAKNAEIAKKSLLFASIILIPIAAIIGFLSSFGADLNILHGARIIAIAHSVVPVIILPFIAIALLSVVLSSADTTLLNSSIILYSFIKKDFAKEKQKNSLSFIRILIFLNGILALLIALKFTDIIGTLLLALAIYAGAFTVPILWGLLGLHSKEKFITAAIIAGGLLALIGKCCPLFFENVKSFISDIFMISAFLFNALLLFLGREKR